MKHTMEDKEVMKLTAIVLIATIAVVGVFNLIGWLIGG